MFIKISFHRQGKNKMENNDRNKEGNLDRNNQLTLL